MYLLSLAVTLKIPMAELELNLWPKIDSVATLTYWPGMWNSALTIKTNM